MFSKKNFFLVTPDCHPSLPLFVVDEGGREKEADYKVVESIKYPRLEEEKK